MCPQRRAASRDACRGRVEAKDCWTPTGSRGDGREPNPLQAIGSMPSPTAFLLQTRRNSQTRTVKGVPGRLFLVLSRVWLLHRVPLGGRSGNPDEAGEGGQRYRG